MKKFFIVTFFALFAVGGVMAQTTSDDIFHEKQSGGGKRTSVKMDWGVSAGASFANYDIKGADIEVTPKIGYHAAFEMGVCFNRYFALVPELRYMYNKYNMEGPAGNVAKVKTSNLDLPLRLEGRLFRGILRLYVGPSFTLMNKCKMSMNGEESDGMRIRPTVTYVAGATCVLFNKLSLGVRYNGQFNTTHQEWDEQGNAKTVEYRIKTNCVSVSVGYLF